MKKFTRLFSMMFLASALVLSGCSKDKKDDPKPAPVVQKTKKEIVTAKTWKVNKVIFNGVDVSDDPDFSEIKSVREKYNTDDTYTSTSSGGTETGIWAFRNNETKFVYDPGADETVVDILELVDNSLKMKSTDNSLGIPISIELHMVYAQ